VIFKINKIFITLFLLFFFFKGLWSEEKFESLIASVDSEAITTYDLSERIKLVLKSLKLEDNIKNRDSVRDRVLELLIIEKLKKIEANKSQIEAEENEVIEFASVVYNFPVEDFKDFRLFLESENLDFEIVLEQLRSELLWKKFSQQMFSSKITINSIDIDAIVNNYKNKIGKVEYDFTEIILYNDTQNNWDSSKKKLNAVLSLIETGSSFDILAEKFSDISSQGNNVKAGWVLEDNLDNETKIILNDMKIGEIRKNIKINNGYKIIKLNKKRKFGKEGQEFTFLKFSSLDKNVIESLAGLTFDCDKTDESQFIDEIKFLKIENILAKDLSNNFLSQIDMTSENEFTQIFDVSGEYNKLFICEKNETDVKPISRDLVERRAFSKKFNQLSNTYITNIRKSANIKIFNK
jgi:peptidyl-prolyl cis-trans isomerase SurA